MTTRSVSPGGALLRASKVFSIPPPLPRPAGDLSSQAIFASNTATLPYPTHQTITTPDTALLKGDWGFKRPLPLRSTTKTSTPLIRVAAIDTFEHVTEFASAADHSINLRKWQEMGVPLSTPKYKTESVPDRYQGKGLRSVFEDAIDYTVPTKEIKGKEDVRWKFKGPWLAGQSEGDFYTYLQKEVLRRKDEFWEFLREACAKDITVNSNREATASGAELPPPVQASQISEEQLLEYTKTLRHNGTGLYSLVRNFLDLPPSPTPAVTQHLLGLGSNVRTRKPSETFKASASPYAESGPPKTHPSAGLSYLRTHAHTFNHPLHGPQAKQPPVKGRVVMPKGASTGNFPPVLGVGGFVTSLPAGDASFNLNARPGKYGRINEPTVAGLVNVEPDVVGGSKIYVELKEASVDSKGRVILEVGRADEQARAVKEGTEPPPVMSRPIFERAKSPESSSTKRSNGGYGVSLKPSGERKIGEVSKRQVNHPTDISELFKLLD